MKLSEKAICISFYEKMDALCQQVFEEMNLCIPTIVVSSEVNENNVLDIISKRIEQGTTLVICRGVLAAMLREKLGVSVLEIKRSYLDIFQALVPYQNSGMQLGCLESPNFCSQVREAAKLLRLNVVYYEVETLDDFFPGYKELEHKGVDVIIGGSWGKIYPDQVHMPYVAVEYSEEAIRACLDDALELFETLYREEEKRDYLSVLLNHSKEGILSVNQMGRITQINRTAQNMLALPQEDVGHTQIGSIFPEYAEMDALCAIAADEDVVVHYGDNRFSLSRAPIMVEQQVTGAVFFFSEEKRLQEAERRLRLDANTKGLVAKRHFDQITSRSPVMLETLEQAKIYSKMKSTVLLTGETGTGKEFFAQSIHNASRRADKPFVSVNCAAFSSSLLESELFGYAEGAFTGAKKSGKAGIFEMAHGGTIFLDEIGEMDLSVQSRLLRVIQEREVMRLGGDRIIPVDVRIIAATNRDLMREAREERFRLDLYYRVNVLGLTLPPLRSRREDIAPMAVSLIHEKNEQLGCRVTGLDAGTTHALEAYDWPGNIRELSNVIEKLVVVAQSGQVRFAQAAPLLPGERTFTAEPGSYEALTLEDVERRCIVDRLKTLNYNKSKTAKSLGIGQATLFRKINRYGL